MPTLPPSPAPKPAFTQPLETSLETLRPHLPLLTDSPSFEQTLAELWSSLATVTWGPFPWNQLEALLADAQIALQEGRLEAPRPATRLLTSSPAPELVKALRRGATLRPAAPGRLTVLARVLQPAAFGWLLVLTSALCGCHQPTDQERLQEALRQAPIQEAHRPALEACLRGIAPNLSQELISLMANGTPEEVAAALESLLEPGQVCGPPFSPPASQALPGSPTPSVPTPVQGSPASPDAASPAPVPVPTEASHRPRKPRVPPPFMGKPLYKGVSFPDDPAEA